MGRRQAVSAYRSHPVLHVRTVATPPEADIWLQRKIGRQWDGPAVLPPRQRGKLARGAKAVTLAGQRDPILIRNRPVTAENLSSVSPRLSGTLLKSFTNASTDENFWIYRMSAQP
jgi:hypothetical protein